VTDGLDWNRRGCLGAREPPCSITNGCGGVVKGVDFKQAWENAIR